MASPRFSRRVMDKIEIVNTCMNSSSAIGQHSCDVISCYDNSLSRYCECVAQNPTRHQPPSTHSPTTTPNEIMTSFFTASMSIETVYSVFSTCHHDRIWAFTCGYNKAAIPRSCNWLKGNAGFGLPVHFRCPNNGFITGTSF